MPGISREIISDNFVGINLPEGDSYDKSQLADKIDRWKYYLVEKCSAKKGDRIIIGISAISVDFVALCFAAFELSLVLVVAGDEPIRSVADKTIVNPKTTKLLPIDILIWESLPEEGDEMEGAARKFNFYKQNCRIYKSLGDFYRTEFPEDLGHAPSIMPDENDLLMLTTSSGSTGTAKLVEHTHKFFRSLCERNSKEFSGNIVHCQNMHHGSSLSVFYLPSLISDAITTHYFIPCYENHYDRFARTIKGIDLNHLSLPYIKFVEGVLDAFVEEDAKFPNMRLSLLTYVPSFCKKFIEEGYIAEVESIFGSNETAGPVFLSRINSENMSNYDNRLFYKPDSFYDITLDDGELSVKLPHYEKTIKTNDLFSYDDDSYRHMGRSDLVRINDVTVDFEFFNNLSQQYSNDIIITTDGIENKIYLVVQRDSILHKSMEMPELIRQLDTKIRVYYSTDRLQIDKYVVEDFSVFYSGVKIDKELIREYFKQHV